MSETMGVDALLQQVDEVWQRLRQHAALIGREQVDRPVDGEWTIKEIIAHIAFWEESVLVRLADLRGGPLPHPAVWYGGDDRSPDGLWPDPDVANAREAEWARSHSYDEVLHRWGKAHERVRDAIRSLSPIELADQNVVDCIANNTYRHYRDHQAQVM